MVIGIYHWLSPLTNDNTSNIFTLLLPVVHLFLILFAANLDPVPSMSTTTSTESVGTSRKRPNNSLDQQLLAEEVKYVQSKRRLVEFQLRVLQKQHPDLMCDEE